jgi:transposase, IS6 family
MRGFERMQTASATIEGLEVICVIRRSHCNLRAPGATAEIGLVHQQFGLAA